MGTRNLFRLTRIFMQAAAGTTLLSLGLNLAPAGISTDSANDRVRRDGLDPVIALKGAHPDIRVYNPYNPLTYLHLPGRATYKQAKSLGGPVDWDGDGRADTKGFPGWVQAAASPYLFLLNLDDARVMANEALHGDFLGAMALAPQAEGDACYIMAPGRDVDARAIARGFTETRSEYLRDFGKGDLSVEFILLHEIAHCGQVRNAGSGNPVGVAAHEAQADREAFNKLRAMGAAEEDLKLFRAIRAVSPFSRELIFDLEHATALALDAPRDPTPAETAMIFRANLDLKDALDKRIGTYDGEKDQYALAVYRAMKEIVGSGELENPLAMRAAALYIEGFEYLAPKAPGVRQAPAPRPSV